MRCGECFILLQCYVISLATKPRSVNLALETTFEFNNKQDVSVIQKIRNFLDKIENAVDTKFAKRSQTPVFTDFLNDLILTINTYDDDDFKQVFRVLNDVVHNFKTKDPKFNEIFDDRLKILLAEMLRKINRAPAKFLRSQSKKIVTILQKSINIEFLNFLNTIYKTKSTTALRQTLDNFKNYGKKTRTSDIVMGLKDIIKNAVKDLIHDQYMKLNENSQQDLKTWIKVLTKNTDDVRLSNKDKRIKRVHKNKKTKNRKQKYTFVTLYPEMITFMKHMAETTKHMAETTKHIEETTKQKDKTTTENEIKEFKPVLKSVSNNSSSLKHDSQTQQTPTRIVTPPWRTIPRPLKLKLPRDKPFGLYDDQFKLQLPNMLRRTELEEKANVTKNETCVNEMKSDNYLSKIKNLEDELQRLREQLKAKITTLKKDNGVTDNKEKDKNIFFRVFDPISPVTLKENNRPRMIDYKPNEMKNTTHEKTNREVSHESKKIAFDLPYNVTYGSKNHSIYISNQISLEMFSPETTVMLNVTVKPIITTNTTRLVEETTILNVKENTTVIREA